MQLTAGPEQLMYLFSKLPGLGIGQLGELHCIQDKDLRLRTLIDRLKDTA